MEHSQFLKLLEIICTLTDEQTSLFKKAIEDQTQPSATQSALMSWIEHNFANNPLCPHCQGKKIRRWGKEHGRQRYQCSQYKKTFTAFTNTPLNHLRVVGALDHYIDCMKTSMTLRPAARECGISLETSFNLRHRLMEIIESDKPELLQGIVEMDETFFRESFKGQRKLSRPARKRGGMKARQRKTSGPKGKRPDLFPSGSHVIAKDRQLTRC